MTNHDILSPGGDTLASVQLDELYLARMRQIEEEENRNVAGEGDIINNYTIDYNNAPNNTNFIDVVDNYNTNKTGSDSDSSDTMSESESSLSNEDEDVDLNREGIVRKSKSSRRSRRVYKLDEDENAYLLVYTKPIKPPTFSTIVTQWRFVLRVIQFLFACLSFIMICITALDVNYPSTVQTSSGINLYMFTSLSSIFIGLSCLIIYCYPRFFEIVPHRYKRISRVEVGFDVLLFGLYLSSSAALSAYGECPVRQAGNDTTGSCVTWNLCKGFGYASAALYFVSIVYGIADLSRHLWGIEKHGVMFARGTWVQKEKEKKKSKKNKKKNN